MSAAAPAPLYQRILLKLSGEALMGDQQFGVDPAVAARIARDVGEVQELGVQHAGPHRPTLARFDSRRQRTAAGRQGRRRHARRAVP